MSPNNLQKRLREEFEYTQAELMKEFKHLKFALEVATENLANEKTSSINGGVFSSHAQKITELTTRLGTLDKIMEKVKSTTPRYVTGLERDKAFNARVD